MQENTSATATLYKELPYPGDGVVRTTVARIVRHGLKQSAPQLLAKPRLRIIDVGCGTGEATAGLAALFPQAEVVGIDINPASLELAAGLARRRRLPIQFVQADLMNDPASTLRRAGLLDDERRFDVVTSVGVLHHLPQPQIGFANVRPFIADDGRFMAFMYSKFGRWNDTAVKQILNAAFAVNEFQRRADAVSLMKLSPRHGWGEFLGKLRTRLRFGPPLRFGELLRTYFRRRKLVHLSDTFSNPCETYYEFAELERLAEAADWKVIGLAEQGGLPTSVEAHTRNPALLEILRRLSAADRYDYFAYRYHAFGFYYWLRPMSHNR